MAVTPAALSGAALGQVEQVAEHPAVADPQPVVLVFAGHPGAQAADRRREAGGEVAVADQLDARPHLADVGDKLLVTRPIEDDGAGMVPTMCRPETMTGQTVAIDSGRYFH